MVPGIFMTYIKRNDKLFPSSPTISKSQRHYDIFLCFFHVVSACGYVHSKGILLHNHYSTFIFCLLNAIILEVIISDFLCLIFISYLACRNVSVNIPHCSAFPITVHLVHCCQFYLPWVWHCQAQKQGNKCPKKFNVFFIYLFFCLGNKIQTA